MKFTCLREDFSKAVSVAQKAVGGAAMLPVLENVYVKAEGNSVEISATNLEISITTSFPADIQNEGTTTIPAKMLASWISLASGENIQIEKSEGEKITLKTKGSNTSLKGMSAEEFPVLPLVEKEDSLRLSQADFKKIIGQTVFSAASGGTRPVLSGVLCMWNGEEVVFVGTDSYRLSERKIKVQKTPKEPVRCIIPAKTLMELERILSSEKEEEVEIVFSKNQILFIFNNIRLISRLIEGQFPNYEQILPKGFQNEITVDRQFLIKTVKRVGIFARENNNNIKLSLSGNQLTVTTDATEIGTEESVLDVEGGKGEQVVALNGQFFLDILMVLSGEKVMVKMGEKLSPIAVVSPKSPEFLHIIMPLKV